MWIYNNYRFSAIGVLLHLPVSIARWWFEHLKETMIVSVAYYTRNIWDIKGYKHDLTDDLTALY